jgi:hypothetical protein
MARAHNLRVDDHVRDGHDALRISTHYFVLPGQIDRLIAATTPRPGSSIRKSSDGRSQDVGGR